jgi:hypothetical protein
MNHGYHFLSPFASQRPAYHGHEVSLHHTKPWWSVDSPRQKGTPYRQQNSKVTDNEIPEVDYFQNDNNSNIIDVHLDMEGEDKENLDWGTRQDVREKKDNTVSSGYYTSVVSRRGVMDLARRREVTNVARTADVVSHSRKKCKKCRSVIYL